MHCVDLGGSFPTSIYLQNLASIQPRTSPVKFARSPRTDPPGESRSFKGQPTHESTVSILTYIGTNWYDSLLLNHKTFLFFLLTVGSSVRCAEKDRHFGCRKVTEIATRGFGVFVFSKDDLAPANFANKYGRKVSIVFIVFRNHSGSSSSLEV